MILPISTHNTSAGGILAIVQARTSSTRLPGKVLRTLAGKPMIVHLLDRLERCRGIDGVVLATSDDATDEPLAQLAASRGMPCIRGALEDVAGRFALALEQYPVEAFVRISGDSPLLDPALVDRIVDLHRAEAADVATNVFPRSFPPGQSVEVVRTSTFLAALTDMDEAADREHVTRYFYRRPEHYRIVNWSAPVGLHTEGVHMAVDTMDDWTHMETCLSRLDPPYWQYGLDRLLAVWPKGATC